MKSHQPKAPLLLATLLLLICLGVSLKWNHSTQRSSEKDGAQSSRELWDHTREIAKEGLQKKAYAKPFALPTKINRGENKTLLFSAPELVSQEIASEKRFTGSVFSRQKNNPLGPLSRNKHTISAFDVAYDEDALNALIHSESGEFSLPITKEKDAVVSIDKVLSRGRGTFSVLGKVLDEPQSNVLLVFHDGVVFGNVTYFDTNQHYEFGASGDGDIAVRLLDPTSFTAPCGHPGAEAAEAADSGDAPEPPPAVSGGNASESNESLTLLDHVVGYGSEARIAEGGVAAIEAKIIASVDRTNLAFSNSLIDGVLLILLGTVEDPAYVYPGTGDTSNTPATATMGSADELGNLNDESDGILDTVTNLKNSLGADGASFVIKDTDASAGVAYRPGDSMIVARTYMTSTRITFVHELGHNLGCRHAWGDTDSLLTNNNYGWRIDPPSSGKVRSVMAYNWSWTRIPYFSNPSVQYAGANTGAVDGYDATGDATADPDIVAGGYDGTNPALGANNAAYISAQAQFYADNLERPSPQLALEDSDGTSLANSPSTNVFFNSSSPGTPVVQTFTITNAGILDLENLVVSLSGTNSSEFSLGALGATTLTPSQSTTFTVTHTLDDYSTETALLEIASNDPDDPVYEVSLSAAIRTELASESFESGFGAWPNVAGSEINWTRKTGGTTSSNTGPNGAADQSYYLYTEASGNFNKTAQVESTFDFSAQAGVFFSFSYHMYGSSIGTLSLDVFDGSWNNDVWSLSGQQQGGSSAAWGRAQVDLTAYAGQNNITLRLRGVTGAQFTSDIAIDAIQILGTPITYTLSYNSDANGTLTGDTSQVVISGGDGTAVEAIPNSGYEFEMWSDSSTQNPRTDTSVSGNLTVEAMFIASGVNSFSDWATENGLTGNDALPLATPSNDGIENLKKYAFNMTEPLTGPTFLTPSVGTSGLPHVSLPSGSPTKLTVEFLRRKSATDLAYTVEFSDLMKPASQPGGWSDSGTEVSVTSIDDDWERVVVEDSVLSSAADYRWARVMIEQTSP